MTSVLEQEYFNASEIIKDVSVLFTCQQRMFLYYLLDIHTPSGKQLW